MTTGMELAASCGHGVYIPQLWVNSLNETGRKALEAAVSAEDIAAIEAGPDNEWYHEAWSNVLDWFEYTDEHGNLWQLWQDGDLWVYCYELLTDEEKLGMGYELEEDD